MRRSITTLTGTVRQLSHQGVLTPFFFRYTKYIHKTIPMKSIKLTTEQMNEFVDYVFSFYSVVEGIYPVLGCTKYKIKRATKQYLTQCSMDDDYRNWGDGDSVDRENVRDIMFEMFPTIKYQKRPATPWFMTDNLCEHF